MSAALTLARARRATLLVDAGQQSNLVAPVVGGLLGWDGRRPTEFYAAGRAELAVYPFITLLGGEVARGAWGEDGIFAVTLSDGRRERARSMVLAPGMEYRYPRLPGMDERWGDSVFHCPFCHGWEISGRPVGVLADGAVGVYGALNLRAWSDRVTLLTNGSSRLTVEQREQLSVGGVGLDERPIAALDGPGTELRAAVFADGGELAIGALLVKTYLYQRSSLARDLGATLIEPDEMLGVEAIKADAMGRTGVPGLYAAGDAATPVPPSLASAVASGYLAGASAVVGLTAGPVVGLAAGYDDPPQTATRLCGRLSRTETGWRLPRPSTRRESSWRPLLLRHRPAGDGDRAPGPGRGKGGNAVRAVLDARARPRVRADHYSTTRTWPATPCGRWETGPRAPAGSAGKRPVDRPRRRVRDSGAAQRARDGVAGRGATLGCCRASRHPPGTDGSAIRSSVTPRQLVGPDIVLPHESS